VEQGVRGLTHLLDGAVHHRLDLKLWNPLVLSALTICTLCGPRRRICTPRWTARFPSWARKWTSFRWRNNFSSHRFGLWVNRCTPQRRSAQVFCQIQICCYARIPNSTNTIRVGRNISQDMPSRKRTYRYYL
jgi:hypothetical protein